jgi:exosortase A-associated hydrolase 2
MAAKPSSCPALPASASRCLLAEAGHRARGAVVYVHPFGEELNKSRRMAALQARAMATAGYGPADRLLGCGDSSGDFGDATWEAWLADVKFACDWLQERTAAPLWLWGLRSGCLLVNEAANRMERRSICCSGSQWSRASSFLQQFLRLKDGLPEC